MTVHMTHRNNDTREDEATALSAAQKLHIAEYIAKGGSIEDILDEEKEPDLPEIYTDSKVYYAWSDTDRTYIQKNRTDVSSMLRQAGFSPKKPKNKPLSQLEEAFLKISDVNYVSRVGDLAGHNHGRVRCGRDWVLVSSDMPVMEAKPGKWDFIREILENQLGRDDPEQVEVMLAWLHQSMVTMRSHTFRPCPALCLVGSKNTGKSLLAQHIIAPLLGGRIGKPAQYLKGGSTFNGDFCNTEVLILDDEDTNHANYQARKGFAAMLKNLVVGGVTRIHPKGKDAYVMPIFWRLIICMNDEVENLQAIPAQDSSIEDKLIVFKMTHEFFSQVKTNEEYTAVGDKLREELPAFAHFLLHEYCIPDRLQAARYGVQSYQNPDYLEDFRSGDFVGLLHETLQGGLLGEDENEVELMASEIVLRLQSQMAWKSVGGGAFRSPVSLGRYLKTLSTRLPETYSQWRKKDNTIVWKIRRVGYRG